MSKLKYFNYLVEQGNPVGEVIGVNTSVVKVRGLHPVTMNSLILFNDGSKGIVREITPDFVVILHLGSGLLKIGEQAVVQHKELLVKVGESFKGRVVSVTGEPLDDKGAIASDDVWPVFSDAPRLIDREEITEQLSTGVTILDSMFPLVLGQRIALIGDTKSGKSTMATQIAINQKNTDRTVVYCLIAKRRSDVEDLLSRLNESGSMEHTIVIVSTMFDALSMSYLAPYVACAMGEYLWQKKDKDVVVIYDDLTNHAQVHRELSLLRGISPGRDSYPGDMFYAHSSLLERAGRIKSNHKTFTALPVVHAPGGDITGYLPTNIMSITDGQYITDMELFRQGVRPAISTGLSVSRVGGRGHNELQKNIAGRLLKSLGSYYEAVEFSHFGSELALEVKKDLERGKHLLEIFTQGPLENYDTTAQSLMLEAILSAEPGSVIDIPGMKQYAVEVSKEAKDDATFKVAMKKLLEKSIIETRK